MTMMMRMKMQKQKAKMKRHNHSFLSASTLTSLLRPPRETGFFERCWPLNVVNLALIMRLVVQPLSTLELLAGLPLPVARTDLRIWSTFTEQNRTEFSLGMKQLQLQRGHVVLRRVPGAVIAHAWVGGG